MIVYKVVRQIDGHWCSAIAETTGLKLIYQVGKATRPTVGKLFAFSNHVDANHFQKVRMGSDLAVFEAEASLAGRHPPKIMNVTGATFEDAVRFWNGTDSGNPITVPGTVFCDYITLLKRL